MSTRDACHGEHGRSSLHSAAPAPVRRSARVPHGPVQGRCLRGTGADRGKAAALAHAGRSTSATLPSIRLATGAGCAWAAKAWARPSTLLLLLSRLACTCVQKRPPVRARRGALRLLLATRLVYPPRRSLTAGKKRLPPPAWWWARQRGGWCVCSFPVGPIGRRTLSTRK